MSLRMNKVSAPLLAAMLGILLVMSGALLPQTVQAQGACALPARLKVGDAVEVISGAANRLRSGPGLSYGKLAVNVKPGAVWYVQQGPVCADGINWYRVAAYDAEGWTAEGQAGYGYYLGRTKRSPQEGATTVSCASARLQVGMVVAVSDGVRQRVHREARKSSPQTAWLYPDAPVTLVKGPVCADGWVWWYISGDGGRLTGWTSEGDGPKAWLAPVAVRQGTTAAGAGAGATTPTLVGTAQVGPAVGYATIFSPDRQAFSLFYDDFIVQTTDDLPSVTRQERVVLPVRSGANGYRAKATLGATLSCDSGGRLTVTFQVGSVAKTMTCAGAHDAYLTVDVVQPADADLTLTITVQARRQKPGAYAVAYVDLVDLSVSSR